MHKKTEKSPVNKEIDAFLASCPVHDPPGESACPCGSKLTFANCCRKNRRRFRIAWATDHGVPAVFPEAELRARAQDLLRLMTRRPPKNDLRQSLEYTRELLRKYDRLMALFVGQTSCRRGCDACCYYDVSTSHLEIELIRDYARERLEKPVLRAIQRRIEDQKSHYIKESARPQSQGKEYRKFAAYYQKHLPCPFLSEKRECLVYPVRPFTCRSHSAISDADRCSKGGGIELLDLMGLSDRIRDLLVEAARAAEGPTRWEHVGLWFPFGVTPRKGEGNQEAKADAKSPNIQGGADTVPKKPGKTGPQSSATKPGPKRIPKILRDPEVPADWKPRGGAAPMGKEKTAGRGKPAVGKSASGKPSAGKSAAGTGAGTSYAGKSKPAGVPGAHGAAKPGKPPAARPAGLGGTAAKPGAKPAAFAKSDHPKAGPQGAPAGARRPAGTGAGTSYAGKSKPAGVPGAHGATKPGKPPAARPAGLGGTAAKPGAKPAAFAKSDRPKAGPQGAPVGARRPAAGGAAAPKMTAGSPVSGKRPSTTGISSGPKPPTRGGTGTPRPAKPGVPGGPKRTGASPSAKGPNRPAGAPSGSRGKGTAGKPYGKPASSGKPRGKR